MLYFHTAPTALHASAEKMFEKMRAHYFWPHMLQDIRDFILWCKPCQLQKEGIDSSQGLMVSWSQVQPSTSLFVDFCGPFIETENSNKYILTMGDRVSGFVLIRATPNQLANTTALTIYQE